MKLGGHHVRTDFPKLGTSLLIASCVILGLRTAKWAIRNGSSAASDRDLENEVENSIHLAKQVLGHLLKKDAGLFPSAKEAWYWATDDDIPK